MRTLLKVTVEVQAGNRAIQDGTLAQLIGSLTQMLQPEATYFLTEKGRRTALVFFDLKDPSQIPQIAEPLFMGVNAEVEFVPVMNQEELQRGLQAWAAGQGAQGAAIPS